MIQTTPVVDTHQPLCIPSTARPRVVISTFHDKHRPRSQRRPDAGASTARRERPTPKVAGLVPAWAEGSRTGLVSPGHDHRPLQDFRVPD